MRFWLSVTLLTLVAAPAMVAAQETALPPLQEAARSNRNDADAQRAYGMALLEAGRYREAQQALGAAARLRQRNPEALYDVARVAFARGDYRASRNACRPLDRGREPTVWGKVCTARAFLVWNRSARAFEELEAALAMDSDHFEALLALGDAHRLRASVSDAEGAYQRAARVSPNSAAPHLGLGRLYAAARRRDAAIASLRRAHGLDSDSPEVNYELGRLLGGTTGIERLRTAARGRPTWSEAQVALGEALLASGDNAGARTALEAAIDVDDRYAAAHVGMGRLQVREGNLEEAEASLRRALEIVPNYQAAVLGLAEMFAADGRHEEAYAHYRQAGDLNPRNPTPLLEAAALALQQRRDVLAAGFLDRVLSAHPNHARALAAYGDVMLARRDRNRAREYYQRALSGQGNFDRARVQQQLRQLSGRRR